MSNSLRPQGLQPTKFLCPWNSPGKNTGVGSHSLLQGIFLTQGLNLGLLHCRQIFFLLSEPPGKHCPTAPTMQNKKFKVWKNKTKQCVYISKSSPLGNPNASLLLAMGHVTLPLITYSTEGLGKRPEAGNGCIIIGVQLCSRLLVQY